mgnify:CR=1 FL=1
MKFNGIWQAIKTLFTVSVRLNGIESDITEIKERLNAIDERIDHLNERIDRIYEILLERK